MEISNRLPKVRPFGKSKNNKHKEHKVFIENKRLTFRGMEYLSHPELREMQRYGTRCVKRKKVIQSICNGQSVIIKQENNSITALVRYKNRYYIAVYDPELNTIKTYLPENSCSNFLDYVQMLIDKEENANKLDIAA